MFVNANHMKKKLSVLADEIEFFLFQRYIPIYRIRVFLFTHKVDGEVLSVPGERSQYFQLVLVGYRAPVVGDFRVQPIDLRVFTLIRLYK